MTTEINNNFLQTRQYRSTLTIAKQKKQNTINYKDATSNVINKTNVLLKQAEEMLEYNNSFCDEDLKKIKDVTTMLNKSLKTMLDGLKLQTLIEETENQNKTTQEMSRFEMLYILRHYKDFIVFILDEMINKIPDILSSNKINIAAVQNDILIVVDKHFNFLHSNCNLVQQNKDKCEIVDVLKSSSNI